MSIIFGVEGVTREIHCHEAGTSVTRLSHGWVIKEILGHKIYTSDHKRDTVMHRVIKEIPRVIIEIPRVIIEIPRVIIEIPRDSLPAASFGGS